MGEQASRCRTVSTGGSSLLATFLLRFLRQLEVVEQHERQILDIFADPALVQELRARHSA